MAAPVAAAAAARRVVPPIPPVVTWLVLTVGAWLVYTAVRGLSPRAELEAALTGSPSPGPQVTPRPAGMGTADTMERRNMAPAPTMTEPANLTPIGQGSHRLAAPAAAAFATWERIFGRTIPVTDSYRSTRQQADAYERAVAAGDPDRFAPPGRSWHERGTAVDVNLGALGANPAGSPDQRATWQRLYSASVAAGWCNPRGPGRGDQAEPWHFSYGGCG